MMQDNERTSVCDLCLDYVSGVCSDEQKSAFERHLPGCAGCRNEIDELRIVWEALPADMERIEPPHDLKKQVMDAVLAADSGHDNRVPEAVFAKRRNNFRRWKPLVSVALVAAFFTIGTIWNFQLYRQRVDAPIPLEQAINVPAAQIERLVQLSRLTEDTSSRSYGVACIVDNGQSKQFVVYLFGAPATTDTQAYQVWLLQDGERRNAGTFRVNEQGIGVMAMPIATEQLAFDEIGITLEPDDRGKQPRGSKMFASVKS
ncbi:anti-sigma factor [Paenibacillus tarimensis]